MLDIRWLQHVSQNIFPMYPALGVRTAGTFPKPWHCRYRPFWPCHFKIWSFTMNYLVWGKTCLLLTVFSQALLVIWCWGVSREKGPCHCDPSAVAGRDRTTQMEEPRLDLDFGPILTIVLDVSIFQIPVRNPVLFTTFPVPWEATGAHTTTVPGQGGAGWAARLGCAAQNWVPAHLGKN